MKNKKKEKDNIKKKFLPWMENNYGVNEKIKKCYNEKKLIKKN